ncbi:MAG: V-type H(+)-translocating pyrophosphatase [Proteobacteria bacterium]|nr:V-type H(+)-translocating pyrophosphatase [Pseudomonadota bacterium]
MSVIPVILVCSILALLSAGYYANQVLSLKVDSKSSGLSEDKISRLKEISGAISEGAMAFLSQEYKYVAGFAAVFTILIFFVLDNSATPDVNEGLYSAIAFVTGAVISSVCAFLGMRIATAGNVRTTIAATKSITDAFRVAFNSGAVMGFGLTGLAVLGMLAIVMLFRHLIPESIEQHYIMEMVAGFGLGGSTVALFGRVGGGIYTKAADVGADLVGKVEAGIPEDDPRNPAVIADNVGDNVGDIAGMGADLFGSCAEATCAALVIGATSAALAGNIDALLYPLLISAVGIPICLITAMFARLKANATQVEPTLRGQLIISTVLMSVAIYFATNWAMIDSFDLGSMTVTRNGVLASVLSGLWAGMLIGYMTERYTSHGFKHVRRLAAASDKGPAINIIYGLSLGYESAVVPVIAIALTTYISWTYAGMYGIAMSAIGMISTIATGLTIDAYGPVSDNAGGIAEMAELPKQVRERTDLLDAAGNTTAAIGKGFAIGSAVLTALALFAAFLTRAHFESLNMLSPMVFAGLFVGGVLPFLFTAQTMLAVGRAAEGMIVEVRRQFREIPGLLEGKAKADYRRCVAISTKSALQEMIAPAILVLFAPMVVGVIFGVEALAGLLAGSLISGVVMALSTSNSGGGWDNAKKYIEKTEGKGTEKHKAAVVGDTVGDPFKDTSGPSLNILMKLMAILSLVFVPFFQSAHEWLLQALGM